MAPTGTITPSQATLCGGSTVELTVSGGSSYQWYRNGEKIAGATAATYTATQGGSYTADIFTASCQGPATGSAEVSEGSLPTGTITPSQATLCGGSTVELTVSGGSSYQWYRNGEKIAGATAATYTATQGGSYTADIFTASCQGPATGSAEVSEGSLPTGTITPSQATLCGGSTVELTVSGGSSYQWYRNGEKIAGATAATYTATQGGSYTADIFTASCQGPATGSAEVSEGSLPTGTITPSQATLCGGSTVELTVSGGSSYQWYRNGEKIAGATAATYTATQGGSYTADIFTASCQGPATGSAEVSEGSLPTGTITPSQATLCGGSTVELTVSGGSSYQWYRNGEKIAGATAATYTATQGGSYTADIFTASCQGPATGSAEVSEGSLPTGTITPSQATLCGGSTVELTVSGGSSYQWYRNGEKIAGATAATYTATQGGSYTADIFTASCQGPATGSAEVSEGSLPTGTITPSQATLCGGSTVELTVSGGSSYQWYRNGEKIAGATAATYTATQGGSYTADIFTASCQGPATGSAEVSEGSLPTGTITPSQATLCGGSTVELTVSGGSSYQWYRNGEKIAGATAATYTATQGGSYTADIFTASCQGPATGSAEVSEGSLPTGTITPSQATLCGGSTVELTVSGGSSYQWYRNGEKIAGATAATYTATQGGSYTADIFTASCQGPATGSAEVSEGSLPTGTITPSQATLCGGSTVELTVSGGSSYQWYRNGEKIAGATAATYTATQGGSYTADIFTASCQGPATGSAEVSEGSLPTGTITPSQATLCGGSTVELTVSGGSSYQWYRNGEKIAGATAATYTATQGGSYTADIFTASCQGPATGSAEVSEGSLPTGTITPSQATLCGGSTVELTVSGGSSYQWYRNGEKIAGATAATYTATQGGSYTADIFTASCQGPATGSAEVSEGSLPTGTITPSQATLCGGSTVELTVSGGSSYQWYRNGEKIAGATAATYTATQGGSYTADIFTASCQGPATGSAEVSEGSLPTGTITPSQATLCGGSTVELTVSGGSSYQWYRNGEKIAGATAATYTATQGGSYTADIFTASCQGPATGSAEVSEGSLPTGTITPSQATLCGGSTVELTVSGGSSYQWYRNGEKIAGATAATYTATQGGSYTADIFTASCQGPATGSAEVSEGSLPTGTITPSQATLCGGSTVELTVSGGSSYQWYRNGEKIAGATAATYTATQGGSYTADIFTASCQGPATGSAEVSEGSLPTGTITPSQATLCGGSTVELTVSGGSSYQWYRNGEKIAGATAATYTATQGGSYTADIFTASCQGPATGSAEVSEGSLPTGTITPSQATLCGGSTVELTVSGGSSYQWYRNGEKIAGATAATYTATQGGSYTADIFTASCQGPATGSAEVSEGSLPTGTITPSQATLCGGSTVELTVSGGSSYQWYRNGEKIAGATAATYTATQGGSYTADIFTASCQGPATGSAEVSEGSLPTGTITPSQATLCGGSTVELTVSGGSSYQWYRNGEKIAGATAATYTATQGGSYTADIFTASCQGPATGSAEVSEGSLPTGTITPSQATLCGGSTVELTVSGGSSYQWYRNGEKIAGATAATYTATQGGSYTADIFTASCQGPATGSAEVSEGSLPTGTITPSQATLCGGSTVELTVSGGSSYQWYRNGEKIAGATAATYTATQGGSYTADIFTASCQGPATGSAEVSEGSLPTGTITPSQATLCGGSTVELTVSGGSSYQWYRNGEKIAGATAATYTATQGGSYTADIFTASCQGPATGSAEVSEGSLPTGTITPSQATLCGGSTVELTVSGGSSYQWYRNGEKIAGATAATYTATQGGSYTADIFTASCQGPATGSAEVSEGSLPTGTITPSQATLCGGSTVELTVSGGSSYQWYRNGEKIAGATAATYTATQGGSYTADIFTASCQGPATGSAEVSEGSLPTGTITPSQATLCGGSTVELTVSGGSSYQWYRNGEKIAGATAATYTATQGGSYTADIFTASCQGPATGSAEVSEGSLPTGTITPSQATLCGGSTVELTVSGGSSYQWYRNGEKIAGATAATYTATQGGSYTADIFTASCQGPATGSAEVSEGSLPTGTITPSQATLCGGSTVELTVSGGSSYQWYRNGEKIAGATAATYTATQGGSYTADIFTASCQGPATGSAEVSEGSLPTGTITPSQATLCGGSTVELTVSGGSSYQWYRNGEKIAGATAATYTATQGGSYTADIFTASCQGPATGSAEVSENTPISFDAVGIDPNCAIPLGSITIENVSGGDGNGFLFSNDNGVNFQKEPVFPNLVPGVYNVLVKDNAGCASAVKAVTINTFTSTLNATAVAADIVCGQNSGSAVVSVTGGTPPYQYVIDGIVTQSNNTILGLSLGVHKVQVKDAAGCTVEVSITIVQINSTLSAKAEVINISCQTKGSVTIQASGGQQPYTYSLDGNNFQAKSTFENLSAGQYKAVVKDNLGCIYNIQFDVTESLDVPKLLVTNPHEICFDETVNLQDPTVTIGSDLGLSYTYWNDVNATSPLLNPTAVTAGTYFIKATNAAGCSTVRAVTVSMHTASPGTITIAVPSNACTGQTITLTASTGASYQWYRNDTAITGATSPTYAATVSGLYAVNIDDGVCSVRASNTMRLLFEPCISTPETNVFVPTAFTPNSNGANDVLRPILYNIATLQYFKVYNRWGQLVFETREQGKGWDGKIKGLSQPSDSYSWILECTDNDGKVVKKSGRSLLIR